MKERFPDFHQMTRREIEDYLVERSLVDPIFRTRLTQAPREVLLQLGVPVGARTSINLIEETPGVFHIVLPRALDEASDLSEAQLDNIVGGANEQPSLFHGYL